MYNFDSKRIFYEAVEEIEILISYAKRNSKVNIRYATFNKSAVILLCTKFEAFIEMFLEEFTMYNLQSSNKDNIDADILSHITGNILDSIIIHKSSSVKKMEYIMELVSIFEGKENLSHCSNHIRPKFRYGKHGEKEIKRLFISFGFKSFTEQDICINFIRKFNSLLSIRNNIIHEDATPSLTHQDVNQHLNAIKYFIDSLGDYASNFLEERACFNNN